MKARHFKLRYVFVGALAPLQSAAIIWLVRGFIEWDIGWVAHMGGLEAETRGFLLFAWTMATIFAMSLNYAIAGGGE